MGNQRRFLVDGKGREATVETRSDWALNFDGLNTSGLSPRERVSLAEWWTRIAIAKHASIAASARFTLQLLSQGAPPDLMGASQQAMHDQIRHARLAFGIARSYGADDVGPGPLPIDGALDEGETEALAIVRTVVREACVGETIAALEATESGAHADDKTVCEVFRQMAEDETRHAALGWRYLRWALQEGLVTASEVRREFELAGAEALPSRPTLKRGGERSGQLLGYGKLPKALRAELHARAWERVIVTTLATVLGEDGETSCHQAFAPS